MAAIHSDEFKRAAVRIALTSGLTRRQVASLLRENERLRKENRILREEREVQKKR
jgi:transposase